MYQQLKLSLDENYNQTGMCTLKVLESFMNHI